MDDVKHAYMICGTPRSGSTLLCEMLARSGVAGRPNSYFRQEDVAYWAGEWGVSLADGTESPAFDRAYLAAMRAAGEAGTGRFGLRLMYPSLADATRRLERVFGIGQSVPALFEKAFGPLLYIHLSRGDKLAQGISLVRAQQSGLWHINADGSVLEGIRVASKPVYDGETIESVVRALEADDWAWNEAFEAHGITPLRMTYEGLTAAPQQGLGKVLARLGLDPDLSFTIPVPTAKMADATSREWMERFRRGGEHPLA